MADFVTNSVDPAWPSSSSRNFLLYEPYTSAAIQASVVSANRWTHTYVVTCATPCPSDLPEQTITHKDGSSWAGNHLLSGSRTAWGCNLGSTGGSSRASTATTNARCSATTVKEGDAFSLPGSSYSMNGCSIWSRSELVTITAGLEKMYPYNGYYDDGQDWALIKASTLSSLGCPSTPASTTATETRETGTTTQATNTSNASTASGEKGIPATSTSTVSPEGSGSAIRIPKMLGLISLSAVVHLLL